jgi:acyl-CoA synthetase (AMP-forming)/AMP-acid ligase II
MWTFFSAGIIYDTVDVFKKTPMYEFLELGEPLPGSEMRIVSPEDGVTPLPDGQSGELQVRGPMIFVRYHNDPQATSSSFVEGDWYRTGDVGIIERGKMRQNGRIKDTVIVHGVSYGIPELETYLQKVDGVTHSFLARCTLPRARLDKKQKASSSSTPQPSASTTRMLQPSSSLPNVLCATSL